MLAATLIGVSSLIPLAGMQRLLATAAPMEGRETAAARPAPAAART
jgi:hypothetical protein